MTAWSTTAYIAHGIAAITSSVSASVCLILITYVQCPLSRKPQHEDKLNVNAFWPLHFKNEGLPMLGPLYDDLFTVDEFWTRPMIRTFPATIEAIVGARGFWR